MFSVFLRRTLIRIKRPEVDSSHLLRFLPNNNIYISFRNFRSTNRHSFTITYLVESCGLSQKNAISASEKIHLESPDRADLVLNLLRKYGFSNTDISIVVRKRPSLLLANPDKTLLPKLEFFRSIGVSTMYLAGTPTLFTVSLENQLVPCYNFLKSVLHSNEKVMTTLKRTRWIFLSDHSKNLVPNVGLLRELGVPESCISFLLTHYPEAVIQRHNDFNEVVKEVQEMGFDPLKLTFMMAIHAISGKGNKSAYDRCYEVYRKWGLSEDEILAAFRKHPHCMILSEKKQMRTMDYLVNKMGWSSSLIARLPVVLCFSLEKRIIPRCSVIQVLSLKGLIKKSLSLSYVLGPTEKIFFTRFVTKHLEKIPQLMSVYQGKIGVLEV